MRPHNVETLNTVSAFLFLLFFIYLISAVLEISHLVWEIKFCSFKKLQSITWTCEQLHLLKEQFNKLLNFLPFHYNSAVFRPWVVFSLQKTQQHTLQCVWRNPRFDRTAKTSYNCKAMIGQLKFLNYVWPRVGQSGSLISIQRQPGLLPIVSGFLLLFHHLALGSRIVIKWGGK